MALPKSPMVTAVPIADKSAARKPLIVALVTIVLLVGITLLLFFVNVKTAGHAISIGKAAQVGQAGIFLSDNTEEVGKSFTIPIKANLGQKKSVAFKFSFTYDPGLSLNPQSGDGVFGPPLFSSLKANLLPGNEGVAITEEVYSNDNTKTVTAEFSWLCADVDCSNALTGSDVTLATVSFSGAVAGSSSIKFNYFDVIDLATGGDIVKGDGSGATVVIKEPCSASNVAVCTPKDCTTNKLFWYDNACHTEQQKISGCTQDSECVAGEACQNGACVAAGVTPKVDGSACVDNSECASSLCVTNLCTAASVCDATHPALCTTVDQCHTANVFWNAKNTLSADGWVGACVTVCPADAPADATNNCVKYEGAAPCDKNNPATCTTPVDCNKEGLLWTTETNTCSVCPAQTTFDPVTASCVAVQVTKIKIELLNPSNVAVASDAQIAAATKYTVKATITPGIDLPKDHLVLISVYYGDEMKTSFVDHKPEVTADGQEVIQFTHDVAPDFQGNLKVKAYVWNNWPLPTGAFDALIPEGGSETYTVQ